MKKIETIQLEQLTTVTGGFWNTSYGGGPVTPGSGPITDDKVGAYYCAKDIGRGYLEKDPICEGKKLNRFE